MRLPSLTTPFRELRDPLLRRPSARWCVIIATTFLALAWIAILAIPRLPGDAMVIVHYTTSFGIDALGSWMTLLRLPMSGTIILLANSTVARALATTEHTEPVITPLLPATVFLEFAIALGAFLLWRVNTST